MKKKISIVLVAVALAGCNMHKDLMPFLGKWKGSFEVSSLVSGGSDKDVQRETLHGYVQVYATGRKYKMELEGEQETIKVDGTWTFKDKRITLKPLSLVIDDRGGSDKRDPNLKYIPAEDVRASYGQPMVLIESADNKSLTGLDTTVGNLRGLHRFVKDSF